MIKKIRNKKAVSPVIATVLLISIVIILAAIILIWALSFIKEVVMKEAVEGDERSAEQACSEVNLGASLSGGCLYLINRGNVPIYQLEIIIKSGGSIDRENQEINLAPGHSSSNICEIDDEYSSADSIEIIPVLLGKTEKGTSAYTCKNHPIQVE